MSESSELRQEAIQATKQAVRAWGAAKCSAARNILNALTYVFIYGNEYIPQLKSAVDDFIQACEDESD